MKQLVALGFLAAWMHGAAAQSIFDLTIDVLPPYPVQISEWERHPERLVFTMYALGPLNQSYEAKLTGRLERIGGGREVRISTRAGYVPLRPISLGPGTIFPYRVSTAEVRGFFHEDSFEFTGLDSGDLATGGRLPEGDYQLCLRVVDALSESALSEEQCSMPFPILYAQAPAPELPRCGEAFAPITPDLVTFRWSAPDAPLTTRYVLTLAEMPEGLSPEDALDASGIVYERTATMTEHTYGLEPRDRTSFPLQPGTTYAWRVHAEDPTESVAFQNEGVGPACSFLYDPAPAAGLAATVETVGGFPLVYDHTVTAHAVTYVLTNTFADPVTITGYTVRMRLPDGSESESVAEDLSAYESLSRPIMPGETRRWEVTLPVSLENQTRALSMVESAEATVRRTTVFRGEAPGGYVFLAEATPDIGMVVRRTGSLRVDLSSPGGFPVEFRPDLERRPLAYEFENIGTRPLVIDSIVSVTRTADGTRFITGASSIDPPITLPPGERHREEKTFLLTAAAQLRALDTAEGDANLHVTLTIFARDDAGALHPGHAAFDAVVRPTRLRVSASAPDGFPLRFYPGVRSYRVAFQFENTTARDLHVRRVRQDVLDEAGVPQTTPGAYDRPAALTVPAGGVAIDSLEIGFEESLMVRLRASTPEVPLRAVVTFEADDDLGATEQAATSLDAVVYRSALHALELEAAYPAVNDTIPWAQFGMIVGFDPYSDALRRAEYDLTVQDARLASRLIDGHTRVLSWPDGPRESQGLDAGAESENRARYNFVNVEGRPPAPVDWPDPLVRGRGYLWEVDATFRDSTGTERPVNASGFFTFGMRRPLLHEPAMDAVIPVGDSVRFRWQPNRPESLFPPDVVAMRGTTGGMIFGAASEAWQLEVARDARFADSSLVFARHKGIETFTEGDPASVDSAYAAKTFTPDHTWTPGTYYWRVQWMREGGLPYVSSPPRRFTIGEDLALHAALPAEGEVVTGATEIRVRSTGTLDLTEVDGAHLRIWRMAGGTPESTRTAENLVVSRTFTDVRADTSDARLLTVIDGGAPYAFTGADGERYLWSMRLDLTGGDSLVSADAQFSVGAEAACGIECTLEAPANEALASGTASDFIGRTVQIGRFDLQIDEATGSPSGLSGRGRVRVPFFRAPLRVAFADLRINTDQRVIAGNAVAETEHPSILSDDLRADFSRASAIGADQDVLHAVHDLASDAGRIVSLFSGDTPVSLPIGVDRTIAGEVLVIAVVGVQFTPTAARMNAVLDIPLPELDTRLGLGVRDVCLTPAGLGSEAVLHLSSDLSIALAEFDSGLPDYTMRLKQGLLGSGRPSGTYCRWSCEGLEEINLAVEHEFPRTWLLPVDEDGRDLGGQAKATFNVNLTDTTGGWDWLVDASVDRAMFADAPGFFFEASEITYDNSADRNAAGMVFPDGYRNETGGVEEETGEAGGSVPSSGSAEMSSALGDAWTGFYIRNLTLYLPEELQSFDGSRVSVAVENLLLDRTGPSFSASLRNVLALNGDAGGNMAGWAYSIDTLSVAMLHGSFRRGHLYGQFRLPVSDTAFAYQATLVRPRSAGATDPAEREPSGAEEVGDGTSEEDFALACTALLGGASRGAGPDLLLEFLIRPSGTIPVDLWLATANLAETSRICAGNISGRMQAGVSLNGQMSIVDSEQDIPLDFANIGFEDVRLMTYSPYASAGTWARSSPQHYIGGSTHGRAASDGATEQGTERPALDSEAAGFAVSIADVDLVAEAPSVSGVRLGVRFDVDVALPGADALLRARADDLTVWGQLTLPSDREPVAASFDEVSLGGLCVGGAMSIVEVSGRDGAEHACLTFYSEEGDRGFRGDAAATFAEQIAAEVSVQFGTKTDGRGTFDYWYVDGAARSSAPLVPAGAVAVYGFLGGAWYNMDPPELPDYSEVASGGTAGERTYRAGRGSGFGFRAGVVIGTTGTPDTFNADVAMGADFTGGGALERLFLRGNGYMMTGLTDRSDAPVEAEVTIDYIQRPPPALSRGPVLDANFNIMVNMDPVLTSRNVGTHLFISPEKWWLRVGNPAGPRASVNVLDFFEMQAYLAAGDELPALPPPPPGAARIRRDPADVGRVAGGSGFMFGASVNLDFSYSAIVYLDVDAGTGFDIAFRNAEVYCATESGATPRGYDFWYAEGQMYAWVSLGFGLDLPIVGRAEVAEAAARATLEGGFPNPAYADGRAELYISLLGGAIVFDDGVDFRVGDACEAIAESPLADIEIITELRPGPPDGEVSPFTEPTALFFINAERPFTIEDAVGVSHTYRIQTDGIRLRRVGASEAEVTCRRLLVDSGAAVICKPTDAGDQYAPLEPDATYTARIEAYIEELQGTEWVRASTRSGETIAASKEATFRTGPLPRTLEGLVQYSYPFAGQRYFLQDACSEGVVVARQPVGHLARHDPETDPSGAPVEFLARFIPMPDGDAIEAPAALRNNNSFVFSIPALLPERIYGLQLVRRSRPLLDVSEVDRAGRISGTGGRAISPSAKIFLEEIYERAGGAQVRQRSLARLSRVERSERLLHSFVFRTSRYTTFQEKLQAASLSPARYESRYAFLFTTHDLTSALQAAEPFDVFDLMGAETTMTFGVGGGRREFTYRMNPLVQALPDHGNRWWRSFVEPRVRQPIRDVQRWGYPRMVRTVHTDVGPLVELTTRSADPPLPSDPTELADRYLSPRSSNSSGGRITVTLAGGSSQTSGAGGVAGGASLLGGGMSYGGSSFGSFSGGGFARSFIAPGEAGRFDPSQRSYPIRYRGGTHAVADQIYNIKLTVPRVLRRSGIPRNVRNRLRAAYATVFTPPTRGNYDVNFAFTPPPGACVAGPDMSNSIRVSKQFTY